MKGAAGRDLKYDPPTSNTGWEMQRDETPAKKKVECWLENRQEWASRVRAHERELTVPRQVVITWAAHLLLCSNSAPSECRGACPVSFPFSLLPIEATR